MVLLRLCGLTNLYRVRQPTAFGGGGGERKPILRLFDEQMR